MHYVLQENVFRESNYDMLKETIKKAQLPFTEVRIFPYVDKVVAIENIPDEPYVVDDLPDFDPGTDEVFVFGAIKLARIAVKKGWKPGSMMNSNHDFMVYKEHYGGFLLNYDSEIHKLTDKLTWEKDEIKFMRPTKDTKSFTGNIFTEHEWVDYVENQLYNYKSEFFNEDTEIQVSTPKNIYKEIRFWVVGGKVVTGSQYRLGQSTIYDADYDPEAEYFVQNMVDLFELADAFVIDVCLTSKGWKIVECGCINCAGFYKSDLQKTVIALEEFYDVEKKFFQENPSIKEKTMSHVKGISNQDAKIYLGDRYLTVTELYDEVNNETTIGKWYMKRYKKAIDFLETE